MLLSVAGLPELQCLEWSDIFVFSPWSFREDHRDDAWRFGTPSSIKIRTTQFLSNKGNKSHPHKSNSHFWAKLIVHSVLLRSYCTVSHFQIVGTSQSCIRYIGTKGHRSCHTTHTKFHGKIPSPDSMEYISSHSMEYSTTFHGNSTKFHGIPWKVGNLHFHYFVYTVQYYHLSPTTLSQDCPFIPPTSALYCESTTHWNCA